MHKLATCSRLPPPDTALGPHVIVAAGTNEAAIWDLSRGGACKQVTGNTDVHLERVKCVLFFSLCSRDGMVKRGFFDAFLPVNVFTKRDEECDAG